VLEIDSYDGFEVIYRKGTADENVIGHSFENDIFFSGIPEYQPEDGHVIIDLGAHIGTFSLLASRGKNFLLTILRLANEKKELNVISDQTGSPTSARLIAETTLLCIKQSIHE
jgi:hypothetical protein